MSLVLTIKSRVNRSLKAEEHTGCGDFVSLTTEVHNLSLETFHRIKGSCFSKVQWLHFFLFYLECLKRKQSVHCRKFANYIEIIFKYFLLHKHYPEIAGDISMFILLSYLFTVFQNEIIVYIVLQNTFLSTSQTAMSIFPCH